MRLVHGHVPPRAWACFAGPRVEPIGVSFCISALKEMRAILRSSPFLRFSVCESVSSVNLRYLPQAKLAASSMLPDPLYFATSGYGQSGRVRTTVPSTTRDPTIDRGATLFSTHSTSGVNASNVLAPTPPLQWNMPGTMNSR